MNSLKNNHQTFNGKPFFSRLIKINFIIVCKIHFGHFLLSDECNCEWEEDGAGFSFGEESLNRYFCNNCLDVGLEIMRPYCRFGHFNE